MIRRYIFPLFKNIYTFLLIVTAALAALLWFFGDMISWGDARPFAEPMTRIKWIIGMFVVWLIVVLLIVIIRWRRNRRMTQALVASTDDPDEADAVSVEMEELKAKLKTALTSLRKSKLGARSLYELPWYIMIGPPGAGKTTAIVNSGLKFPLLEEGGEASIGGVGGTRNCDWWFTDHAVMIDTAGRYTTQESDADADNRGWIGFLGLLKKYRKRQPINGAIIAISLSDLSMTDEVTQAAHAKAIRRRLHELRDKLGVRFPVYVLFTKADLIAGFVEFFDNLGKEAREQVWGFTLPLDKSKGNVSPVAQFDDQFSALLTQLNSQSLERMAAEIDHQRRSLIAGFPGQVASVRQVARDFLAEVFQDNKFEHRHMLRGVYFTSGTQEGTPIDRLMMGMARTFGLGRQAIGSGRGTGRSFFLTRLFEHVIFREAGLVSADDKVERRYKWIVRGAIAATVLVALGTGALWTRSYLGNQAMIAQAAEMLDQYQTAIAPVPQSPIGDSDIVSTLPALAVLRGLPANPMGVPEGEDVEVPASLTWGLYQGRVIGSNGSMSYRAGLNQNFLPRLLLRLEGQIQSSMNEPDVLYEALKVYLMLGQQGPLNAEMVKEWMNNDWNVAFPGPAYDQVRADLNAHLDAMMAQPMVAISLNGPLVEQAQDILSRTPMAQRIYASIINSPDALALPEWRISDIAGPAAPRVLVRSSGKPLNDGIPGVYTYSGFNEFFLIEALTVANRIQSEAWVLGEGNVQDQSDTAMLAVTRDVLDLYYNDYITYYEGVLADVDIVPMESIPHATEVTNVLSGPTSPILNLLTAVSDETRLTENRSLVGNENLQAGAETIGRLELKSLLSVQGQVLLQALMTPLPGQSEPIPPGGVVAIRFQWLADLVFRPEGQPSQLDGIIQILLDVNRDIAKIGFSGQAELPEDPEDDPVFQLNLAASRIPDGPLPRWSTQIAAGASGISATGARAQINAKWSSAILPVCEQSLNDRYPFNRRAKDEVAMADFTRMFAPGGLLDVFFNENLAKFVDTTTRPWTFKKVNNIDLGISDAVLEQFMIAAEIRSAFFPEGPSPKVAFGLTPEALDPAATSMKLEIDGTAVTFEQGTSPSPSGVTWPGAAGFARLVLDPAAEGVENELRRDGPWAWMRMLDAAEVRGAGTGNRVIFKVGGRLAMFLMQTQSSVNPFGLAALSKFSCPKTF
jgi:type VI secretion system protein ImpL